MNYSLFFRFSMMMITQDHPLKIVAAMEAEKKKVMFIIIIIMKRVKL